MELVRTQDENRIYELLILFKPNFPLWEQQVADFHLWAKKLAEHSEFIALYNNSEIVGIIAFYDNNPDREIAYITVLGILPNWQRKGYGTYLLHSAMNEIRGKHFERVQLQVDKGNTAIEFYKKYGFEVIDENSESYTMCRAAKLKVVNIEVDKSQKQSILSIVKAALTGIIDPLPDDFLLENVYPVIKEHGISSMAISGLELLGIDLPKNSPWKLDLYKESAQYAILKHIADLVFQELDAQGIPYMPLKGYYLREIYPKPYFRMMTDVDVIVREEDYAKVRRVLLKMGLSEGLITDYEYHWDYRGAVVEFHSHLVSPGSKDYDGYYSDYWHFAKVHVQGMMYRMTDEDMLVYQVMHFAKHYREKGIGLRQMLDFYVIRNARPDINMEYVREELKKMQLDVFYKNICDTLDVWFDNSEHSVITQKIEDTVFASGSFGNWDNLNVSSKVRSTSKCGTLNKVKRIVTLFFPPHTTMRIKYPVLFDRPYLLPFYWCLRLGDVTLRKLRIKQTAPATPARYKKRVASQEEIEQYKHDLNLVGLDFNY